MRALRLVAALVTGCAVVVGLAAVLFGALRAFWPEYAAAEPEKAYTLGMLLARLGVAAVLTVSAAIAATLVAGETRAAWILGALFVLLSLPSHLHHVWDDYPAWYHFVYLVSLVPIAWICGRGVGTAFPRLVRA